jgi:hypothetical protein
MNRRNVLAGALTLPLLLPSCGKPVSRYYFKMTAEVETPRGLKTGSAVQSIEAGDIWIKLIDGDKGYVSFAGEAFVVDLGDGQAMFVTVSPNRGESLIPEVQSALDPDYVRGADGNIAAARKMAALRPGARKVELRPTNSFELNPPGPHQKFPERPFYPILVRFRDERDSRTVEEVDPANLAASFGKGVKLKRITVEIVDGPITEAIVKRLPWLVGTDGKPMDKSFSQTEVKDPMHFTFPETMGYYTFKREFF